MVSKSGSESGVAQPRPGSGLIGAHVFVDESKVGDYLLVAGVVVASDLDVTRGLVRGLVHKGSHRVHMSQESEPSRKKIATAIAGTSVIATIYTASRSGRTELDARAACLGALIEDTARGKVARLVIERDDSLHKWDLQRLIELTREYDCKDSLVYDHLRAREELLLCLPDVIAWCWAKGGIWRQRIQGLVNVVREV